MAAILLALLSCASGCAILKPKTLLIGGERQIFFRPGTAVPAVSAEANTNGVYQLTATEMEAILNP